LNCAEASPELTLCMKIINKLTNLAANMGVTTLLLICLTFSSTKVQAQTIYVDAVNGKKEASGTANDPLKSLEKAVERSHELTGDRQVHIRLAPGLYTISSKLIIKTGTSKNDLIPYFIEAAVMPDDPAWTPAQMPVIQSVAGVNDTTGFRHTIGLAIEKSNVSLLGLKFLGNPNRDVPDFYPIRRADKSLSGLTVSQCYFIGDSTLAAVQSAFWVSGPGVHVDHCIFNSCKIAFVLGATVNDFSLSYSIINGAYNTAIWYGFAGNLPAFNFSNNIVANCNYFMVYPVENGQPNFTLRNSFLVSNKSYLGNYPKAQDKFVAEENRNVREINVIKHSVINFSNVQETGIIHDFLTLTPQSAAKSTLAGLSKKK
jgi:hypothetical protein